MPKKKAIAMCDGFYVLREIPKKLAYGVFVPDVGAVTSP